LRKREGVSETAVGASTETPRYSVDTVRAWKKDDVNSEKARDEPRLLERERQAKEATGEAGTEPCTKRTRDIEKCKKKKKRLREKEENNHS